MNPHPGGRSDPAIEPGGATPPCAGSNRGCLLDSERRRRRSSSPPAVGAGERYLRGARKGGSGPRATRWRQGSKGVSQVRTCADSVGFSDGKRSSWAGKGRKWRAPRTRGAAPSGSGVCCGLEAGAVWWDETRRGREKRWWVGFGGGGGARPFALFFFLLFLVPTVGFGLVRLVPRFTTQGRGSVCVRTRVLSWL